MNSSIVVDGKTLELNRFIRELNGNLVNAIARSLKASEGKRVRLVLNGDTLSMFVDENQVPLDLGRAAEIVGGVLKGLLSNLKGAENAVEVSFECERE